MKIVKLIAIVMITVLLAVGCGSSEKNSNVPFVENYEFTAGTSEAFPFPDIAVSGSKETVTAFSVMDDSKTALLVTKNASGENVFAVYENGTEKSRTVISPRYREVCYNAEERCFYTFDTQARELHKMDEDFQYVSVLASIPEAADIGNMDVVDDRLYFMAITKDITSGNFIFDPNDGNSDLGEKAFRVDLSTGELEKLDIENVICQSCSDGTLFFCARRGGQYLLNVLDRGTLKTVKLLENIGYIYSFAVIGDEMIYTSAENNCINRLNLNSGEILSETDEAAVLKGSDFEVYKNGLIFLNRADNTVKKLGNNETGSDNKELPFYGEALVLGNFSSNGTVIDTAALARDFGISASISKLPIYDEEIKLMLLAGDDDVDIYIFSSSRRTGIDIRRMGCYVPLTDKAILGERGRYFDWLRDYTANGSGEVWCVPLAASTYAAFCVPENLKTLGIATDALASLDGFFSALEKVKAQSKYKFYGSALDFGDVMTESYNVNHSYFEYGELFGKMFERLYSGWLIWSDPSEGKAEHPLFNNIAMSEDARTKLKAEDMAFTVINTAYFSDNFENTGDWLALPLPALSSADEKNPVTVDYAIINPFSKKKEAAEAYLGYIAENGLKYLKNKSFIFNDRALYGDFADAAGPCFDGLYGLFENGAVYERVVPVAAEFREDIIAYQKGELTLDEYIADLERVSEMSSNE